MTRYRVRYINERLVANEHPPRWTWAVLGALLAMTAGTVFIVPGWLFAYPLIVSVIGFGFIEAVRREKRQMNRDYTDQIVGPWPNVFMSVIDEVGAADLLGADVAKLSGFYNFDNNPATQKGQDKAVRVVADRWRFARDRANERIGYRPYAQRRQDGLSAISHVRVTGRTLEWVYGGRRWKIPLGEKFHDLMGDSDIRWKFGECLDEAGPNSPAAFVVDALLWQAGLDRHQKNVILADWSPVRARAAEQVVSGYVKRVTPQDAKVGRQRHAGIR